MEYGVRKSSMSMHWGSCVEVCRDRCSGGFGVCCAQGLDCAGASLVYGVAPLVQNWKMEHPNTKRKTPSGFLSCLWGRSLSPLDSKARGLRVIVRLK